MTTGHLAYLFDRRGEGQLLDSAMAVVCDGRVTLPPAQHPPSPGTVKFGLLAWHWRWKSRGQVLGVVRER